MYFYVIFIAYFYKLILNVFSLFFKVTKQTYQPYLCVNRFLFAQSPLF